MRDEHCLSGAAMAMKPVMMSRWPIILHPESAHGRNAVEAAFNNVRQAGECAMPEIAYDDDFSRSAGANHLVAAARG